MGTKTKTRMYGDIEVDSLFLDSKIRSKTSEWWGSIISDLNFCFYFQRCGDENIWVFLATCLALWNCKLCKNTICFALVSLGMIGCVSAVWFDDKLHCEIVSWVKFVLVSIRIRNDWLCFSNLIWWKLIVNSSGWIKVFPVNSSGWNGHCGFTEREKKTQVQENQGKTYIIWQMFIIANG